MNQANLKPLGGAQADRHDKQRNQLQQLNDTIRERKTYYNEQEALIAKLVADGNLQLRELEYAILEARHVVKALEIKRRNLYEENRQLEADMQNARDNLMLELGTAQSPTVIIRQNTTITGGIIYP